MQVDPIKPTLKALKNKRLTLKYDETLSNLAFKLNLRRYSKEIAKSELGKVDLTLLAERQGLTLVHVRAQLEQLQDTFMSQVGFHGGQKSSS